MVIEYNGDSWYVQCPMCNLMRAQDYRFEITNFSFTLDHWLTAKTKSLSPYINKTKVLKKFQKGEFNFFYNQIGHVTDAQIDTAFYI